MKDVLVGIILELLGPFLRPRVRNVRARHDSPLKATFAPEPIYNNWLGVFAAVPTTLMPVELNDVVIEQARTAPLASYVCPTPFVITLRNTSNSTDPRDIYVREIFLDVKKYSPLQQALNNMALVQATTVQAGGRMLDGYFTITLQTTRPIRIPLFRSGAGESEAFPFRPIRIPADAEYQILIHLLPLVAGRYLFDVAIETDEGGQTKHIPAAQNIALLECRDLSWAKERIKTFNWMSPDTRESGVDETTQKEWAEYHQHKHAPYTALPPGRRVKVDGQLPGEAND